MAGLFLFGKLYSVGMAYGMPQLSYVCCALAQGLAVALVLTTNRTEWSGKVAGAGCDQDDTIT